MLVSTRGIALNLVKYSDNKLIIKVYTEQSGLQSFIVHNGRSSKNNYFRMFSHLALVDLVTYNRYGRDLQQIKEVSLSYVPVNIPFDIRKSSIALFIKEVICACIKEHEPNKLLFGFLQDTVRNLDSAEKGLAWFHINFLAKFSEYLGFMPENMFSSEHRYFDMLEGTFVTTPPVHMCFMTPVQSETFHYLLLNDGSKTEFNDVNMRDEILVLLLDYYKYHLPGMGKINSHEILKEVLAG